MKDEAGNRIYSLDDLRAAFVAGEDNGAGDSWGAMEDTDVAFTRFVATLDG